jgi:hypothetical protein
MQLQLHQVLLPPRGCHALGWQLLVSLLPLRRYWPPLLLLLLLLPPLLLLLCLLCHIQVPTRTCRSPWLLLLRRPLLPCSGSCCRARCRCGRHKRALILHCTAMPLKHCHQHLLGHWAGRVDNLLLHRSCPDAS